jgi:hypothetical protein
VPGDVPFTLAEERLDLVGVGFWQEGVLHPTKLLPGGVS